jgi:ribosome-binding protein aMBF1 (putative translation factor)
VIRSENEYQEAVGRLKEESQRIKEKQKQLQGMDLSKEEIKRVLDPVRSFHEQLKEEVTSYERLKRGEFDEVRNFDGIGRLLVALRIAQGISQRDLAERLGVHESQISRDERNEYHGVTVERASRILDALGADTRTAVLSLASPIVTTSPQMTSEK